MTSDIINKRLEQLFVYLTSLSNFQLGNYLSDIDKIIFITLIQDYHKELEKTDLAIRMEEFSYRQTIESEIEEESEYGLNQKEKNLYAFFKDLSAENIMKGMETNEILKLKIEQLIKRLSLDRFDSCIYKSEVERAASLLGLIQERTQFYKYKILNLIEPIVYCRAIQELSHEVQYTQINNDLQAARINEAKKLIDCLKETILDPKFIWNITTKERPKH